MFYVLQNSIYNVFEYTYKMDAGSKKTKNKKMAEPQVSVVDDPDIIVKSSSAVVIKKRVPRKKTVSPKILIEDDTSANDSGAELAESHAVSLGSAERLAGSDKRLAASASSVILSPMKKVFGSGSSASTSSSIETSAETTLRSTVTIPHYAGSSDLEDEPVGISVSKTRPGVKSSQPVLSPHALGFLAFMKKYRMKNTKEVRATNTGMNGEDNPAFKGSFHVPDSEYENFLNTYSSLVFDYGIRLGFTEMHKLLPTGQTLIPVLIDFDFRFSMDDCLDLSGQVQRIHTEEQIQSLIELYHRTLCKYVDLNDITAKMIRYFVMEKPRPVVMKSETSGPTKVKDGIHIFCKDIQTTSDIQLIVREEVLEKLGTIFPESVFCKINSFREIYDRLIITSAPWTMYGSRKENNPPYLVTKAWHFDRVLCLRNIFTPKTHRIEYSNLDYIELLSLRFRMNSRPIAIKPDQREAVEAFNKKEMDSRKRRSAKSPSATRKNNNITLTERAITPEYTEFIRSLTMCLNEERADSYEQWIRVGWCLYNINPSDDFFEIWVEFSRLSEKFNPADVEDWYDKYWNRSRREGDNLTVATLKYWARKDNPEMYHQVIMNDVRSMMMESLRTKGAHNSIASILRAMYGDRHICYSIKDQRWLYFCSMTSNDREYGIRWKQDEKGTRLRKMLVNKVVQEYLKMAATITPHISIVDDMSLDNTAPDPRIKICTQIAHRLLDNGYLNAVMSESAHVFYEEDTMSKMDTNPYLLGCENGVIDLKDRVFREGIPDDYISMSTKHNYIKFSKRDPRWPKLKKCICEIFPRKGLRKYMTLLLASCLEGTNKAEKFWILTGIGRNGKSAITDIMLSALGDYAASADIAIFTQKRQAAGSAAPQIVWLKGRRFVYMAEPEGNEKLNIGLMKQYTGNDKVNARGLFQDMTELTMMCKFFMVTNWKPDIPNADDYAVWRRICVCPFISVFMPSPDPEKGPDSDRPEFPIDESLKEFFKNECGDLWLAYLFHVYCKHYVGFYKGRLPEPTDKMEIAMAEPHKYVYAPEIVEETMDYMKEQSLFESFYKDCIRKDVSSRVRFEDIFKAFNEWYSTAYLSNADSEKKKRAMSKSEMRLKLNTKLGSKNKNATEYSGIAIDMTVVELMKSLESKAMIEDDE